MYNKQNTAALSIARAHIKAWSNHDFKAAKQLLADDVKVVTMTTQPIMDSVNTKGADIYMQGLEQFARGVEVGSAKELSAVGDSHNALIALTVRASFGPGTPTVTLPGARLYLIEDNKIKSEQVIFYASE